MRGSDSEGAGSANGESGKDPCAVIDSLVGSAAGNVAGLGFKVRPVGVNVSVGYGRFRDDDSAAGRAKVGGAVSACGKLLLAKCR